MVDVARFGEPMVEFCATETGRFEGVYMFRRERHVFHETGGLNLF